jgi:DNA anti-recombination protein RmuC
LRTCAQAEALIRDTLLERSQLALLNADLAAERNRVSEAESARERAAGELAVRLTLCVAIRRSSAEKRFGCQRYDRLPRRASSQASEAARDALQTELKDVKQQLWESEEHSRTQCAPTH